MEDMPGQARIAEYVSVHPVLFAAFRNNELPWKPYDLFLAYRDSLLLRALDPKGSGNLWLDEAIDGLIKLGFHRATAYRIIGRAKEMGFAETLLIPNEGRMKIKLVGIASLLRRFGLESAGSRVRIQVELLCERKWRRNLEAAAAATITRPMTGDEHKTLPRPISRWTRTAIHGASESTQRRAERDHGIIAHPNYVATPYDPELEDGDKKLAPGTWVKDGMLYEQIGNTYRADDLPFVVKRRASLPENERAKRRRQEAAQRKRAAMAAECARQEAKKTKPAQDKASSDTTPHVNHTRVETGPGLETRTHEISDLMGPQSTSACDDGAQASTHGALSPGLILIPRQHVGLTVSMREALAGKRKKPTQKDPKYDAPATTAHCTQVTMRLPGLVETEPQLETKKSCPDSNTEATPLTGRAGLARPVVACSASMRETRQCIQRRVVTASSAPTLKPEKRRWDGADPAKPIRGGHYRLYPIKVEWDRVFLAPVTLMPEDLLKACKVKRGARRLVRQWMRRPR